MYRGGARKRRDANEAQIVRELRQAGVTVSQVSGVGLPDLLLRFRMPVGMTLGVEVKSGKGKRTDAQEATQWPIIRSSLDAIRLLGIVSR